MEQCHLREIYLGWSITGTYDPRQQVTSSALFANANMKDPLADKIEKFWSAEDVTEAPYTNPKDLGVKQLVALDQRPSRSTITLLSENSSVILD
jgi:hypothetical protein